MRSAGASGRTGGSRPVVGEQVRLLELQLTRPGSANSSRTNKNHGGNEERLRIQTTPAPHECTRRRRRHSDDDNTGQRKSASQNKMSSSTLERYRPTTTRFSTLRPLTCCRRHRFYFLTPKCKS
ncbi:Hypothetical protein SMAX5B_009467 [Scophthalmus maximus]|uniref:Uncharacterized protein n=1 Tax=Scophthalmus maximus TaxID=52904 RepID=A0A2U9BXM1_SCOMX|nr:Hypothetical protein SMAX5B_009467 [Scophthalmus maximus]